MSGTSVRAKSLVNLTIPCAPELLPRLRAGLPVFAIRLEDQGDGTHSLIVNGVNGPLADPFDHTLLRAESVVEWLRSRGSDMEYEVQNFCEHFGLPAVASASERER